ncbi:hypothetical protein ACIBG8_42755 [Nonomuraea sp. NPDC050556]|uniref:hypothetical protein n=1 Tax=Nonomuraea sp. NPDC050556 TaxID=3364369 RepID=UPI0037A507F7
MGDFLEFYGKIRAELAGTAYLLTGNYGQAVELADAAMSAVRTRWTTVSRANPRDRLFEFLLAHYLDGSWPPPSDPAYGELPRNLWALDADRRALAVACFHIWHEIPRAVFAARWNLEEGRAEYGRLLLSLSRDGSPQQLCEAMAELSTLGHPPAGPAAVGRPAVRSGVISAIVVAGLLGSIFWLTTSYGKADPPYETTEHAALAEQPEVEEEPSEETHEASVKHLPKKLSEPIRYAYSCDEDECDSGWRLIDKSGRSWAFDQARASDDDGALSVSPDGRHLVYLDAKSNLVTRDLRKGTTREISGKVKHGDCGVGLVFSANSRYVLADSGEDEVKAESVLYDLKTGQATHIPLACCAIGVSDSGVAMLANRAVTGDVPGFPVVSQVMEFRPGYAKPRTRFQIDFALWESASQLSPDGRTLAFTVDLPDDGGYGITTMDAQTGRVLSTRPLKIKSVDDTPSFFGWRNSNEVVLEVSTGDGWEYHLVNARTGTARKLALPEKIADADSLAIGVLP